MPDYVAKSDSIVAAYNAKDFPGFRSLVSPKLEMAHYNRNYASDNVDSLIETMIVFAEKLMKDRKFDQPERVHQIGNVVVREAFWGGTPDADIPGFAEAGVPLRVKLCSIMRFDESGILVEWKDYG